MVNAITSCFTLASSSAMRRTMPASTRAFSRIFAAAAAGTTPVSASVSVAASSTSSQRRYLLSSLQTWPISSRVYREINRISPGAHAVEPGAATHEYFAGKLSPDHDSGILVLSGAGFSLWVLEGAGTTLQ